VYSFESEGIVTSMKRFYKNVDFYYGNPGNIFVGVSFRDNIGHILTSKKEHFTVNHLLLEPTETSLEVCGIETDESSEWTPVVGPIKGSYVVKKGEDKLNDYI